MDNLKIVYSFGGLHDGYAIKHNLPSCTVVTDDFAYHAHGTIVEKTKDGFWSYTNETGKKNGKPIYKTVVSCFRLEYGEYWNPYKQTIENLSCMHDSMKSRVDDFERIMRLESFGIIFH